jgi:branched-chain amino acid transport system permease protein
VDSKRLALLVLAVLLVFPSISTNLYYLQVIQMVAISAMLALGLNLVFGHTGQISIGQAGFYAIGAYVAALTEIKLELPFPIAWMVAVLAAVFVAGAIGNRILKLHGHYLAMATIAFGLIVELLATNWVSVTGGHDGIYIPTDDILGAFLADNMYYLIITTAVLLFMACENIVRSRIGRAIKAVREDEIGAASIGIEHSKYKIAMFMVGAAFSAIAGILYAHLNKVITPEVFNMHTSVLVLMMVVVGGMGSNIGVVLGAAFITILPEMLYGFADYNILVYGLLVCLALIFMPRGLIGMFDAFESLIKRLVVRGGGKSVAAS